MTYILPYEHDGVVNILDIIIVKLFAPTQQLNHGGTKYSSALDYLNDHDTLLKHFH